MDGNAAIPSSPAIDAAGLAALAARLAARAAWSDETGLIARDSLHDLRAAGLLGLAAAPEFGGGGIGLAETATIIGRLAEGDPAIALIVSMQFLQHAGIARSDRWPPALRARVSRSAVEDGALLNALRVEPELGTPARGGLPATTARRVAEGWRISGRKIYSTGSTMLRWGVVWGRTDEETPRVGAFLVPLDQPGVSIVPSWNQIGMRGTESHTVVFDDVLIPADHEADLRDPADWASPDLVHAVWGNVVIAALYNGVARSARRWLLAFLRDRAPANLGAPLSSLPRFHTLVGEIDALLLANRHILAQAIADEADGPDAIEGGLVKHIVTENAISVVEKAIAATGNPGLSRDNPLERHYRDVLCARVHTPQGDVVLAASGRRSLAA